MNTTELKSQRRFSRAPGPGQSQSGFTLIEVLISVLVLLVGTLGVVGMQMLSLQSNQGAYYRSQAVYIASEILDAMRANPTGAASYVGTYPEDTPGGTVTVPADPSCQETLTGCTPQQAAAQDLHFWSRHFMDVEGLVGDTYRPSIPNGRTIISADGNEYTVQVFWTERVFDNTVAADGSNTRSLLEQAVTLTTVLTP